MDNLIPGDVCLSVCLHCLMHPSQLCKAVKAIDLKYTVLYISHIELQRELHASMDAKHI